MDQSDNVYKQVAKRMQLRSPEAPVVVPRIETKRLILRGLCESDVGDYARWVGNGRVVQHVGDGQPLTPDDAWRKIAFFIGHWQMRGYGQWAVEEKSTSKMVGRVGLHHPHGWPGVEVGWMVDPERWGEGFASEAAHASLEWGFRELGLDEIVSVIKPENLASIRVAEKIGEQFWRNDSIMSTPVLIYGIRRCEFQ